MPGSGRGRLGWILRYLRQQLPPWDKASAFRVQWVGALGPVAPEAQDHKHYGPQQQEGTQGPKDDPKGSAEFHAQVLAAISPGRVDGKGHTAGDRERDHNL